MNAANYQFNLTFSARITTENLNIPGASVTPDIWRNTTKEYYQKSLKSILLDLAIDGCGHLQDIRSHFKTPSREAHDKPGSPGIYAIFGDTLIQDRVRHGACVCAYMVPKWVDVPRKGRWQTKDVPVGPQVCISCPSGVASSWEWPLWLQSYYKHLGRFKSAISQIWDYVWSDMCTVAEVCAKYSCWVTNTAVVDVATALQMLQKVLQTNTCLSLSISIGRTYFKYTSKYVFFLHVMFTERG